MKPSNEQKFEDMCRTADLTETKKPELSIIHARYLQHAKHEFSIT